jgi:cyclic dehypoxanthinyl futalosine synthase
MLVISTTFSQSNILRIMERLTLREGLDLFKKGSLQDLQQKAQEVRNLKNPCKRVTFVLDSNPNYTNVCHIDCSFCAFYRHENAKDAYTKSIEEVMAHLEKARRAGIKTVLLQGGVNDNLKIDYHVELVKNARARYPDIHPHFFSAVEIANAARVSSITLQEALEKLWKAGLRTIPGGGAEILSERVRQTISPKKMGPHGWIDFHHLAHQVGFKTTATMMYGHIEEPEDIVEHLECLRQHQDKIAGFLSFIPWSYKRDRTVLRRKVKNWAGQNAYFRILAFSRIYLDNFDHIGASWFSEGKEIGMESLHYGADDFGGTIIEENVHRATEWICKADHNDMVQMIRRAGFDPAQRNSFFQVIQTYEGIDTVDVPPEGRVTEPDNLPPLGIFATTHLTQNIK